MSGPSPDNGGSQKNRPGLLLSLTVAGEPLHLPEIEVVDYLLVVGALVQVSVIVVQLQLLENLLHGVLVLPVLVL